MTYAACQFALSEIGQGVMEFLKNRYRYPSKLPAEILKQHQRRTLDRLRWSDSDHDNAKVSAALVGMQSSQWAEGSGLLHISQNVWPANICEWLGRIGITAGSTRWMTQPVPGRSETYGSRLESLIAERNPIAHGRAVDNLLSSALMLEWLKDCRDFMERCAMTVELHLAIEHKPRLLLIGSTNRGMVLSNKTVAMGALRQPIAVGDHVLLGTSTNRRKVARIQSIMSSGISLESAQAGQTEVAIGLSTPHQNDNLYTPP